MVPVTDGEIGFLRNGIGLFLTYELDGELLKFERSSRKWKIGGVFISRSQIANQIFGCSNQYTDWLFSHIGVMIDSASHQLTRTLDVMETVSDGIKRELEDVSLPSDMKRSEHVESAFVYLMRHTNGLVKIGYSRNPRNRERTLQAEDPRLEMIHCFRSGRHVETRLHKIFSDLRIRGEWFSLEDRHIDWIVSLCGPSVSL